MIVRLVNHCDRICPLPLQNVSLPLRNKKYPFHYFSLDYVLGALHRALILYYKSCRITIARLTSRLTCCIVYSRVPHPTGEDSFIADIAVSLAFRLTHTASFCMYLTACCTLTPPRQVVAAHGQIEKQTPSLTPCDATKWKMRTYNTNSRVLQNAFTGASRLGGPAKGTLGFTNCPQL